MKSSKSMLLLLAVALFSLSIAGSAFASSAKKPQSQPINAATAVAIIVKGLDLNIDEIRFFKEPKASDYFPKAKDNVWYSKYFIIASFRLNLPKDINPNSYVTREQFASWLASGIASKGDFAWTDQFVNISDAKNIAKANMDAVQKMVKANIMTLDSKGRFYPDNRVTLTQANASVVKAKEFVSHMTPIDPPPVTPETGVLTDIALSSVKLTDEANKVTISAKAPHPGYGIEVAGIRFEKGKATIDYRVVQPDPNGMYAQVITEVKAYAYVPTGFAPVVGVEVKAAQ